MGIMVWALCLGGLAIASPLPDDGDAQPETQTQKPREWGFSTPEGPQIDIEDDDPGMTDFVAAEKRKPAPPTHSHLYAEGRSPLLDEWPLHVVATNERFVVVELPVLIAMDRAAFIRDHRHGIRVEGHWSSGAHTMVVRQDIRPADVLAAGPTFAFLKAALPNPKAVDQVRVLVKAGALPGPPEEGVPPLAPTMRDLYAHTTVYSR